MKNLMNDIIEILSKYNFILTRRQKKQSIGILCIIIVGAGFETIGVSAILPFVQAMLTPEALMQNKMIAPIAEALRIQTSTELILWVGVGVIAIYLLKNIYLSFSAYKQLKFQCDLEMELSTNMLQSYMKRPYAYFLNINSSVIMQNVENDISSLYNMMNAGFKILVEGITTLMIGGYIFIQDIGMALSMLVLVVLCFIGAVYGFKGLLKRLGIKSRQYGILKYQSIYQATNGIKEIKVMNRGDYFTNHYNQAVTMFQKIKRTKSFISILPEKIIEAVCVSGLIGIVCIRLLSGGQAIGYIAQLAVFAVAAFRILPSISRIIAGFNDFVFGKPSLDAVYQNLQEVKLYEKTIVEYQSNVMTKTENHHYQFNDRIEMRDIMWSYPNAEKQVLQQFNITIEKGQSVAFIGTSGAGKSTAADILLGLLQPKEGMITMDGVDIFTIPSQWCKIIGYVPQSVFMTDDTIRNNVAFGIEQDDISDEQVWNALEQAQLRPFIESLPTGLDTMIGERGVRFSGGQKQRVAIARALYYNPEILVLDEATAALDNETEAALMESIEALQGKKTLLIVAHRLTTIKKCNKVYEIVNGQAVLQK